LIAASNGDDSYASVLTANGWPPIATDNFPEWSSNLLLAFISTVILALRTYDHIFVLSKTICVF
jgi:hypothetical protein